MPEFVLRSLKLSGCGKSPTVGWRFKTGTDRSHLYILFSAYNQQFYKNRIILVSHL